MKLIIFDFDGTLVDSRKLILESHRIIFGDQNPRRPRRAIGHHVIDSRRVD